MSEHFSLEELACTCKRCAGKVNVGEKGINPRLFEVLEAIRKIINKPIHVDCGYRCPEHNKEVNKNYKSTTEQHPKGTAADITWEGFETEEAIDAAEKAGADGIGRYRTFVHVDVRGYSARW